MTRRQWGLFAARYSLDGTTPLESFGERFSGLAIGTQLPGWLSKFEFAIRARSRADAMERERRQKGQQMVIYDNVDAIIARGWVRGIRREGLAITYECTGIWERLREIYFTGTRNPTSAVSTTIDALIDLSSGVNLINSLAANITANAAHTGDIGIREIEAGIGIEVAGTIEKLLAISDGTSAFDWWTQEPRFEAGYKLGKALAYYQARPATGTPAWLIRQRDLLPDSGAIHSHIYDLASTAVVVPGRIIGHAYTGGAGTNALLIDTQENWFTDYNVQPGDTVINRDFSTSANINYGFVEEVGASSITAPLTNSGSGTNTDWHYAVSYAGGDDYEIVLGEPTKGISVTGTANYWAVTRRYDAPALDQTQAAVLAARILEAYEGPVYQQSIAIGSRYITAANGGRFPLWRLLVKPSIVRVQDDTAGIYEDTFDLYSTHGAYIVAASYNHDQGTISLTPNTFADTLGALLQRAGVIDGRVIEDVIRPAPGEGGHGGHGHGRGSRGGPAGQPGGDFWRDPVSQMPPEIRNNRRLMQKWLEENGYI